MTLESKTISQKWLYRIGGMVLAIALFSAGFLLGGATDEVSSYGKGDVEVINQTSANISSTLDFDQFWEVWDLIEDSYVDQPVSTEDLYYGAMEGLLSSLDDPYSVYFDPAMAQEFSADLAGTFFGIGAEIGLRDGQIVIISPLEDSPAMRAGIRAGDKIVAVDGEDTYGFSVNDAVTRIRGDLGAPVVLTVLHEGAEQLEDIEIIRDEIVIESVSWEIRDDGIGVIEIYMFNDDTTPLFDEAVQELLAAGVDELIVDLRNNPGGLLTAAINIASYWIEDGPVVLEEIQGRERAFNAVGSARLAEMETVVLVNGGSASGSEILAGALQDYGLATIIGETTYGKGSVQDYYEFDDGSAVKMTVAKWLTPAGRSIDGVGIDPDILIEYTLEHYDAGEEPQLEAAVDYFTP